MISAVDVDIIAIQKFSGLARLDKSKQIRVIYRKRYRLKIVAAVTVRYINIGSVVLQPSEVWKNLLKLRAIS